MRVALLPTGRTEWQVEPILDGAAARARGWYQTSEEALGSEQENRPAAGRSRMTRLLDRVL